MGRGLVNRPRACATHHHRPAADRCDDCRQPFCAECFVRAGPILRCQTCHHLLPVRRAAAARRRRLRARLGTALRWARERSGGAVAAVSLASLLAGAAALSWWDAHRGGASGPASAPRLAFAGDPGVALRIATERYCSAGAGTAGDVPSPGQGESVDLRPARTTRTATGAIAAAVAAVLPDSGDTGTTALVAPTTDPTGGASRHVVWHDPLTLVRRYDEASPGWRSRSHVLPQQVGFDLGGVTMLDRVAFRLTERSPQPSWARDVSLLLSMQSPDDGYYQVGRWTLAPTTAPQELHFFETPARYVRLCIHSTQGTADFASLGAVVLGAQRADVVLGSRPLLPTPAARRALTTS